MGRLLHSFDTRMAFTFKQFHIDDGQCAMAVSTDGVLLGAYAPLAEAKSILDIGAGSGLLSLMAAQRTQEDCQIVAIELDQNAANACQINVNNSPWRKRIKVVNSSIQAYCDDRALESSRIDNQTSVTTSMLKFDHIISNPPFFERGPSSQSALRATARHTHNLPFTALFNSIKNLLSPLGLSTIILPVQSLESASKAYKDAGLALQHQRFIASVQGKSPYRVILCLQHLSAGEIPLALKRAKPLGPISENSLFIRDSRGQFGPEMASLCQDFYLKL
jgi:tRNA1Val (adenine37-N6)-methyltransferase